MFWNRNKKNSAIIETEAPLIPQEATPAIDTESPLEYDPLLKSQIETFLEQKGFFIRQKDPGSLSRGLNITAWHIGPMGKLVRQNLLRWWMDNFGRLKNVITLEKITNDRNLFTNYPALAQQNSMKIPFGISRVKKISRDFFKSGDFIFTNEESRQFTLEFFVAGESSRSWLDAWQEYLQETLNKLGLQPDKMVCNYETPASIGQQYGYIFVERYNYKFKFPFGYENILQISNRSDIDFQTVSDLNTVAQLQIKKEHDKPVFPHIIEIKLDVEKMVLALILNRFTCAAYDNKINLSIVFSPLISPIKCVIFAAGEDNATQELTNNLYQTLSPKFKSVRETSKEISKTISHYRQFGVPYIILVNAQEQINPQYKLFDCENEEWHQLNADDVYNYLKNGVGI